MYDFSKNIFEEFCSITWNQLKGWLFINDHDDVHYKNVR